MICLNGRKKRSDLYSAESEFEANKVLEEEGRIYLFGEVTTDKCEQLIKAIHRLEFSDFVNLKDKILTFYINTEGGNAEDAIALYDLVRKFAEDYDVKIVTIGSGSIQSAGAILLQSGDERRMTKNSLFMFHEAWYSTGEEKTSIHQDMLRGVQFLNEACLRILTQKCKAKAKKELTKLFYRRDTYLTAEKCKAYGLIDTIV